VLAGAGRWPKQEPSWCFAEGAIVVRWFGDGGRRWFVCSSCGGDRSLLWTWRWGRSRGLDLAEAGEAGFSGA
jgi:hypothetical protein